VSPARGRPGAPRRPFSFLPSAESRFPGLRTGPADDFDPGWSFTQVVDVSKGTIQVLIAAEDHDDTYGRDVVTDGKGDELAN
jgi:hypothetical protein